MNRKKYNSIKNQPYRLTDRPKLVRLHLCNAEKAKEVLTGASLDELVDFLLFIFVQEKEARAKGKRNE